MSAAHFLWLSTGSTESPMILTPRLSNSGFSRAMVPSSVVQTGVKSFGCENSTAQLLPIQSWKRILPSVVSASKSGAVSLSDRVIGFLQDLDRKVGQKNSRSGNGRQLLSVAAGTLPGAAPMSPDSVTTGCNLSATG